MRDKILNIRAIEWIVFLVIWGFVFSVPFFNNRIDNTIDWGKVKVEWLKMLSYLILFLLNTLVLVPRLLFKKKYRTYIFVALLSAILVIGLIIAIGTYVNPPSPIGMPPMEIGPGMPPMELGPGMPAPLGYKPLVPPAPKSLFMIFVDSFILSLLIVGLSTAIKMVSQWLNEENRRKDIEKEQLKTELALLRHQVSPHFFMNTLNNIHSLIDINAEDAKNTIIQLSVLMRYLLYETAHGQTTLKKEMSFIESYIALMQLRFPKKVSVTLDIPADIKDFAIPPMLFISFIENAFKHGVSYQSESFVYFKVDCIGDTLNCIIRNSKAKVKQDKSNSGLGLANIKQSLKLLFNDKFSLHINDTEKEYEVLLSFPVSNGSSI